MTNNRRRIHIPNDIKRGDVLVLRDGQRRKVDVVFSDEVHCEGFSPGGFNYDGRWWFADDYCERHEEWDVVAIERKADLGKPVKPPRDDRDAVWLMSQLDPSCPQRFIKRIRAIARRLNGGKAVL